MKNLTLFACLLLLLAVRCSRPNQLTDRQQNEVVRELDNDVYSLQSAGMHMQVDARNGGRIISLRLDDAELLTPSDIHASNYGSTFWPSPQSDWNWPPSPVLDVQPYQSTIKENALALYSQDDPKSGFRFGKHFSVQPTDSAFVITYTITNISGKTKSVAPWEVTRVPSGGLTFFAAGAEKPLPQSNLEGIRQDDRGIVWFAYDTARIHSHQKLFMNAKGWLAHVHGRILLVKAFPDVPAGKTTPKQEEVEVYANKERTYVELENQGAYVTLAPQDSLSWTVKWYVRTLPGSPVIMNQQLVDQVENMIK